MQPERPNRRQARARGATFFTILFLLLRKRSLLSQGYTFSGV
jgi:hypothetical protein